MNTKFGFCFASAVAFCSMIDIASAAIMADLDADYLPASSIGQTSDDVGIEGTVGGTWHYFQDLDSNVTNGNNGLLTWKMPAIYENCECGYAGTNTQVGLPVPIISSDRLFDGPNPPPPAGSLMGHPSNAQRLAIEYRAHPQGYIDDLSIDYRFEKPNLFGSVSVSIIRENGSVLFSKTNLGAGAANQTTAGTLSGLGTLSPGQRIWLVLDANGGFEGDQTWLKMTLRGTNEGIPEPSCLALIAIALGAAAVGTRRR